MQSLKSLIDIPCFKCLINEEVNPYHCTPSECKKLEVWLIQMNDERESKRWTPQEEQAVIDLIKTAKKGEIETKIQQLSQELGRTPIAIRLKYNKLKRKLKNMSEMADLPKPIMKPSQEMATSPKLVNCESDLDLLHTIIKRTIGKADIGDLIRIEVTKGEKGLENWSVNIYKRK